MELFPAPSLPAEGLQHIEHHLSNLLPLTCMSQKHARSAAPTEPPGADAKPGWASISLPEMRLGMKSNNISSMSQRSAEERSVREFSPQPGIEFPAEANQEARKKLIRGDSNVPKSCTNILKLNIYSKVK